MASINPSQISDQNEQKWVVEISEILKHQLKSEIETPFISIFQVPISLNTQKPEAFEPQHIGLGPIHHFRPMPYKNTEQKKLDVVQKVLKYHNIKDFNLTVLDNVQKLVPVVRSCYDMFLQDDNVSLAWIFAIDGFFLLDLLHTYKSLYEDQKERDRVSREEKSHQDTDSVNILAKPIIINIVTSEIQIEEVEETMFRPEIDHPNRRLLAQDMLMSSNQIPFMVLKEIDKALHTSLSDVNFSPSIFRAFSEIHSPLELCSLSQAPVHVEHLLDFMYYSILNNVSLEEYAVEMMEDNFLSIIKRWFSKVWLYFFPPSFKTFSTSYEEKLEQFPKEEIVQLYNQIISALENFTQKLSGIPSASTLHKRAGFRFHCLPKNQGITKIVINGKHFHLPCVTLNVESDTILRNLVAYEMLIAKNSNHYPLIDFIGLMCELIANVNDVKLLKKENIIKCDKLSDADVVKLFVEMSSFMSNTKMKDKCSKLKGTIEEVKKVYESKPIVKVYLFPKKMAQWLLVGLRAIGGFVESSWKIVVFMVSVVTVFMLVRQAYCDNFECDKTNVITLATHADH